MANITKSGKQMTVLIGTAGTLVESPTALADNSWYEVVTAAASGSALPFVTSGAVFETPDVSAASPITLVAGDSVIPLTMDKVCKTDGEVTFEEGTIDVTDDCGEGYNSMILDGFTTLSGTINGFTKIDDTTGELVTGVKEIFGRFIDLVTDDGEGSYTITPKSNERVMLQILLNNDAVVGETLNYIITPALIQNLSTGAGLKDAQKRDITWTKAEGPASLYQRTAFAADLPGA
jgi:hypothetical protein